MLGFGGVTAEHGAETAWRPTRGEMIDTAQCDDVDGVPAYVRLDRLGDRVTVWASVDGEDWTPLDQAVLDLPESIAVGVAVNSHSPERICEASFVEVRIVGLDVDDS